jgi:hypothetical protein
MQNVMTHGGLGEAMSALAMAAAERVMRGRVTFVT